MKGRGEPRRPTERTHPKLPIWSNRNGTITVRSTIRGSDGVGVAFFTFLAFSRTLFSHDGFTKTDSELHCVHPFILIKNLIAEKCELHRRPKLDSCLLRGNARDFFDNIGIADFGLFGHLSQNTIQHQS